MTPRSMSSTQKEQEKNKKKCFKNYPQLIKDNKKLLDIGLY